jgi:flagellar biosynthesis/type III secretory pathway chaperone
LTQLTGVNQFADADKLGPHWNEFRTRMLSCRDMHRRNEILIMRKLDAIRGALESMNVQNPSSSVEIYDRLGQIKRIRRLRNFAEV